MRTRRRCCSCVRVAYATLARSWKPARTRPGLAECCWWSCSSGAAPPRAAARAARAREAVRGSCTSRRYIMVSPVRDSMGRRVIVYSITIIADATQRMPLDQPPDDRALRRRLCSQQGTL